MSLLCWLLLICHLVSADYVSGIISQVEKIFSLNSWLISDLIPVQPLRDALGNSVYQMLLEFSIPLLRLILYAPSTCQVTGEKHLLFIVGASSVKDMKGGSLPAEPCFWVSPDARREFAVKANQVFRRQENIPSCTDLFWNRFSHEMFSCCKYASCNM